MIKKTICITGASSGIGAELARQYAAKDIHLLLVGRNQQRLTKVADDCKALGATVVLGIMDVTDRVTLEQWCKQQYQLTPIDLLIANAGMSGTQAQRVTTTLVEKEALLVDVHLQGTLNTVHAFLPYMIERGVGQIALMSSMVAFICLARNGMYGPAKAAILHYGLGLRQQLASKNIAVSVICPGFVDSALTQLNKHRMPFFLATDKACHKIIRGLSKNKPRIIFPLVMYLICRFFTSLPIFIQGWLARRMG